MGRGMPEFECDTAKNQSEQHGQDRDRLTVVGFDEISWLRGNSPAWRLLRAENAPLVLSFLDQVFVAENIRSISATELANRLDDELYALNERLGERAYPKPAKAYLDDWAAPEAGWLRGEDAVRPVLRSGPVTVWRIDGKLDPGACRAPLNAPLRRVPQQPDAYCNLGNVYKQMGRLDEAISCYRQALLAKLVEASQEASQATGASLPGELADVLEVLRALTAAAAMSWPQHLSLADEAKISALGRSGRVL